MADLYLELRSQKTIFVQGKEYPANFYGDGYFYDWKMTGLLPTALTVNASPGEGSIDILIRATTTITISGSIYPGFTAPINISISSGGIYGVETVTTVTTSSNGEFSMSFVPTSVGVYTIEASFPGNNRYEASSAGMLVNARYNFATLIAVLAIIGTIVVSAFYFSRTSRMGMQAIGLNENLLIS